MMPDMPLNWDNDLPSLLGVARSRWRLAPDLAPRSSEAARTPTIFSKRRRMCGDPPVTSVCTADCGMFGSGLGDRRLNPPEFQAVPQQLRNGSRSQAAGRQLPLKMAPSGTRLPGCIHGDLLRLMKEEDGVDLAEDDFRR